MSWTRFLRVGLSRLCAPMLLALCSGRLHADGAALSEPELSPGRSIAHCDATERHATAEDVPLATRIPVLSEPKNWLDVPGPRGERVQGWEGRRHGYRIVDSQGRLLQAVPDVSMPRWSPDGRWLAVSRWSPSLPYELALVEVRTGRVIPFPQAGYLDEWAWSPDSRRLAFAGRSNWGDPAKVGWLSVPDTSIHMVAQDLNSAFECVEMAWSADSRRFVAVMHRENEDDDVRVTDLWLFELTPGVCRLTATPAVEESNVSWLDDRQVIFRTESSVSDSAESGYGTVLVLPALAKSLR